MADVKFQKQEMLSAWMEYRLKTDKLSPPIFRCRLRPVDEFNLMDGFSRDGDYKYGRAVVEIVLEAVAEWDLSANGEPILPTVANKAGFLRPLLAEMVESRDQMLGICLAQDAQNRENFLKN